MRSAFLTIVVTDALYIGFSYAFVAMLAYGWIDIVKLSRVSAHRAAVCGRHIAMKASILEAPRRAVTAAVCAQ